MSRISWPWPFAHKQIFFIAHWQPECRAIDTDRAARKMCAATEEEVLLKISFRINHSFIYRYAYKVLESTTFLRIPTLTTKMSLKDGTSKIDSAKSFWIPGFSFSHCQTFSITGANFMPYNRLIVVFCLTSSTCTKIGHAILWYWGWDSRRRNRSDVFCSYLNFSAKFLYRHPEDFHRRSDHLRLTFNLESPTPLFWDSFNLARISCFIPLWSVITQTFDQWIMLSRRGSWRHSCIDCGVHCPLTNSVSARNYLVFLISLSWQLFTELSYDHNNFFITSSMKNRRGEGV